MFSDHESKTSISRRSLFAATALGTAGAALGAGVVLGPQSATPAAAQQDMIPGVRRSVNTLSPNGRTMLALRRGVATMKARPFSDPTSWAYQAAIHGLRGLPPVGLPDGMASTIGTCVHGGDWQNGRRYFLPWHRLYLHFFERILRAASGDPGLMLPYWDYSALGGERLPTAFRWPNDFTNPLYEARRNTYTLNINRGDPLPFTTTDSRSAMVRSDYASFSDMLEGTPHGGVHVDVGGFDPWTREAGLMADQLTAGNDPIFWLHHCNIDRLWKRWLNDTPGARNPTNDSEWLNRSYNFYDENGNQRTVRVADAVETGTLSYSYDDDRPAFGGFQPFVIASAESGGIEETLAASEGVTLSGEARRVEADARGAAAESGSADLFFTDLSDLDERPVMLRIEGLSFDEAPGIIYHVYVNLPEDAKTDPAGPYYAGLLAPFGFRDGKGVVQLDITGVLNRQIDAETFFGGRVTVDFVPANLPAHAAESGVVIPPLTFESLSIVRE